MKLLITLMISILSNLAFAQNNPIVCRTKGDLGSAATITILKDKVTIDGGLLSKPHVFTHLTRANGLITDHGLAIYMQNQYGCLRNTVVITELQEPFDAGYMEVLNVGTCSGGSTPDSICHPQQ